MALLTCHGTALSNEKNKIVDARYVMMDDVENIADLIQAVPLGTWAPLEQEDLMWADHCRKSLQLMASCLISMSRSVRTAGRLAGYTHDERFEPPRGFTGSLSFQRQRHDPVLNLADFD